MRRIILLYVCLFSSSDFQLGIDDWTALAPAQAMAWAQQLPDPYDRRRSLELVLTKLVSSDTGTALRESEKLPPGSTRNKCIAESIAALSFQDPGGARAAVEALPNVADRMAAFSLLASNLADRDPATALEMLTSIGWKDQSPSASFKWEYNEWDHPSAASQSTVTSSSGSLIDTTIASLMMASPKATADALAILPVEQQNLLSHAMISWANQQPEAASRWLQSLPTGPAKDHGIQGLNSWLISGSSEPDYPAALAWANASTPDQRLEMMRSTLSTWKSQDATAARAAVDRLPISEEQRQSLLQNFN